MESVISEDRELYASLQMNLPQLPDFQQQFLKNAAKWTELVKNKDKDEFVRRMKVSMTGWRPGVITSARLTIICIK